MPRIAIIPGDGIGGEVTDQAVRVLRRASRLHGIDLDLVSWDLGAERFLERGVTVTEEEWRSLADDHDAILLGALGDPRVPGNEHARDILLGLRFRLDLFVNYRPCVLLDPAHCPLKGGEDRAIEIHVFRENTEGVYVGMGGTFKEGTPDEVAIQEDVNTRKGVERIVRAAFDFAAGRGGPVTLVDKANAMPAAGGLWRRVFREVGDAYPAVERNAMYVDAMAMDLVRRPERYRVVVASNLFGDIISDLAAEITGGLGLAPSASLHPGTSGAGIRRARGLFEPVHGSAPDIAGQGVANPLGAVRCIPLLLDHLGHPGAARSVEAAVSASLARGITTPDLGGSASTDEVGTWIADHLADPGKDPAGFGDSRNPSSAGAGPSGPGGFPNSSG